MRGKQFPRGLHLIGPRCTPLRHRPGRLQCCREGAAPCGEPPAAQLGAGAVPRDAREVRRHAPCQALGRHTLRGSARHATKGWAPVTSIRAAAVQLSPVLYSREGTVERVVAKIDELAARGVQFATFPETVVPYYPYFSFVQPPYQMLTQQVRLLEQGVTVP